MVILAYRCHVEEELRGQNGCDVDEQNRSLNYYRL